MSALLLSAIPLTPQAPVRDAVLPPASVLVVDDDRSTQALLSGLLSAQGLHVHTVSSIKEAHDLLEDERFELIIVDGLLPDGTGMEFITQLREAGCTCPIVFVSSFFKDLGSFRELHDHLQVTAVLHKPLSPSRLIPAVRNALRRH